MGGKNSKTKTIENRILIEPNGGLGNQLFQIANGYAYSLRHNVKFNITIYWKGVSKERPTYWRTYLKNLKPYLVYPTKIKKLIKNKYTEPKFSYEEIPKFKDFTVFQGYYQSEKYFSDFKEEVRKLLTIPEDLKPDFHKEGTVVAIHIRRGDYLKNLDYHIILDKEYYEITKNYIENKLGFVPNYYYFSDDINWVKQNFTFKERDKIIEGFKDYQELYIMSLCDHFIIANSTFSWWGAWLSTTQSIDNKIVICPDKWFGPSGIKDYQNIYCKNWIRMDIEELRIKMIKDEYLNMDKITSSISQPVNTKLNPFDIYVINLKHRTDRREEILNDLKDTVTFNIKFFDAVKYQKGWIGCGISHLSLVKYAYANDLPYIIVAEDDFLFKVNNEKVNEIISLLTSNLDDWEIFNGSPSFWDKRDYLSQLNFYDFANPELKDKFVKVDWGQSTSFMIYNKKSYSKILNYNFRQEIDQYVSKNFFQIIYKPEPFSIQKSSYSDVSNITQTKDYENFFINQYEIVKNCKLKDVTFTIGIYSIFIDKYQIFYENFIKNCEENFLPQYTKYYYIVTDNKDLPKYNDRTFFFNTEKIGWPYETLYRFKYFLKFKEEEIKKSDIYYFVNSNGKFLEPIGSEVFPDDSGYVFTQHHGYLNKSYKELAYEKNNPKSTAYIKNQKINFEYFAGGFYGATRNNYIQFCKTLDKNITIDEKNNFIALWHDESHINKYCLSVLNYNFKKLGIEYHIPDEMSYKFKDKKLIYLDKHNYISINVIKNGKPSTLVNNF